MDRVLRSLWTAAALCALALALAGAGLAAPVPESSVVDRSSATGNSWSSLGRSVGPGAGGRWVGRFLLHRGSSTVPTRAG